MLNAYLKPGDNIVIKSINGSIIKSGVLRAKIPGSSVVYEELSSCFIFYFDPDVYALNYSKDGYFIEANGHVYKQKDFRFIWGE